MTNSDTPLRTANLCFLARRFGSAASATAFRSGGFLHGPSASPWPDAGGSPCLPESCLPAARGGLRIRSCRRAPESRSRNRPRACALRPQHRLGSLASVRRQGLCSAIASCRIGRSRGHAHAVRRRGDRLVCMWTTGSLAAGRHARRAAAATFLIDRSVEVQNRPGRGARIWRS